MADLPALLAQAKAAHAAGDVARANACYRQYLAARPNDPAALHGVALLAQDVGQTAAVLPLIERAAALAPQDPAIAHDRATLLALHGRTEEAIAAYRRALGLDDAHAGAHANLATLLLRTGRTTEAIAHFKLALARDPALAPAAHNLPNALLAQGRIAEALAAYDRAIAAEPANAEIAGNRAYATLFAEGLPEEEIVAAHAQAGHVYGQCAPLARDGTPLPRGGPLRVGLVSPDFREHSVAAFVRPLLQYADAAGLQFYCYASVDAPDAVTAEFRQLACAWHDVARLPDDAAATLIAGHGLHVLVDLAGHTQGNRLGILARRPVARQVSAIGYPHDTGLPAIDARLTDRAADPHASTPRVLRIAPPFLCYSPPAELPDVAPLPAAAGKPFTFGSFNNLTKLSDSVMAAWSRILQQTPGSRLVLKAGALRDEALRGRTVERFAACGVAPERILPLPPTARVREHLAQYGQVDLALDTFPYAGTTTTCEALLMGVPVVALAGGAHRSRVGVSLLQAVGLEAYIGSYLDDYIRIAVAAAGDRTALADLRSRLRGMLLRSPLCDGPAYVRRFVDALR